MDENVERIAEYVEEAEPILREAARGLRARNRDVHDRELHVEALARTIAGIPVNQHLPMPSQKFEIIKTAVKEWREKKGLTNEGLWAAARLHHDFRTQAGGPPPRQDPGNVLGNGAGMCNPPKVRPPLPRMDTFLSPIPPYNGNRLQLRPEAQQGYSGAFPRPQPSRPLQARNLADLNGWGSMPSMASIPEVIVHQTGKWKALKSICRDRNIFDFAVWQKTKRFKFLIFVSKCFATNFVKIGLLKTFLQSVIKPNLYIFECDLILVYLFSTKFTEK